MLVLSMKPHRKTAIFSVVAMAAAIAPAGGAQPDNQDYLGTLKQRLQTVLHDAGISAPISLSDGELKVQYRIKKFETTRHYKDKAHINHYYPEYGPDDSGFEIDATLMDHKNGTPKVDYQAVKVDGQPFQTHYKGGYWLFDYTDRQIVGKSQALHFYVAWGRKLPPTLLARLNQAAQVGTTVIR